MREITKGFIRENPVFVLALGLCPALAVTTEVVNAIGMGLSTLFVLLCSNIIISMLKNFISDEIHIPAYIVVIATFVTIVDMVLEAYFPELSSALGTFVKLIVVNCIILGRAEAYASSHGVWDSIKDALGMGVGFTLALIMIALVREVFGMGTILGWKIYKLSEAPVAVLAAPAGALLVMGYLKALFNHWNRR